MSQTCVLRFAPKGGNAWYVKRGDKNIGMISDGTDGTDGGLKLEVGFGLSYEEMDTVGQFMREKAAECALERARR